MLFGLAPGSSTRVMGLRVGLWRLTTWFTRGFSLPMFPILLFAAAHAAALRCVARGSAPWGARMGLAARSLTCE